MPQLIYHQRPVIGPFDLAEPMPPVPPRVHSRLTVDQPRHSPLSILNQLDPTIHMSSNHSFLRLDDLPSPDREWQLLENIGDGTYGEVFHVSMITNH